MRPLVSSSYSATQAIGDILNRRLIVAPAATGSETGDGDNPPPRPPAPAKHASSACEPHRSWIEAQVQLGRNAQSIYQDLVQRFGFEHRYNSVKRFVRGLKARDPERFDVLESLPGEEAQVDFGQGALTRRPNGKYRRPYLFVMTLKYSGKSFRKVVWKADQASWARLHEDAFRAFGGSVAYVVLDNLKALAQLAVRRGYKVLYREAHQLIEEIHEARELGELRKYRAQMKAADLLVIDDLFLRRLPAAAGEELANVLMTRYEKLSTIVTSNRPVDGWPKLLGDVVIVTPLLDRLMHHSHLLKFDGKSWRLKEAAARVAMRARSK